MKKVLALLLAVCLLAVLVGCHCNNTDPDSSIYWIKEESGFVDYEIAGDSIRFRYRICFANETPQDAGIKLAAKFSRSESEGWLENQDFFNGLDSHGEWSYQTIEAGKKTQLVFTFEGKYLGGEVNEELAFPDELIVSIDTRD